MTGKLIGQDSGGQKVLGWSAESAARLKEAVQAFGSQQGVAEAAGISRPSLVELIHGRSTPKRATLEALCAVIGVDVDVIRAGAAQDPQGVSGNQVKIRELDLTFGMGATYLDLPVTECVHEFPRDWVRTYTKADPDRLFFAQGIGDSMASTILDSDLLLIDSSQNHLNMGDKIWAISCGDVGMVKRLRPNPGGSVTVLSDNQLVPAFDVVDGEMAIIGRVVAIVRKM